MATQLHAGDFADAVIGILNNYGKPPSFANVMQTLQNTTVLGKWLTKDKVVFEGGIGIRRSLADVLVPVAKHVGLLDEDNTVLTDHFVDLTVPWVHAETQWSVERRKDVLMAKGKSLVRDQILPREQNAMISLTEHLEQRGWATPDSATDVLNPNGVPLYVVKNATTGFNGASAFGSTTAGINTTDHPNYKNYTETYTNLTAKDGIRKWRKMILKLRYEVPKNVKTFQQQEMIRHYVNDETWLDVSDYLADHNDNLGRDLSRWDGQAVFERFPIETVTKLNDDTSNPVYTLDNSWFFPVVLSGDYLVRDTVKAPRQRNVATTYITLSYNFVCTNRKRQGIMYVA